MNVISGEPYIKLLPAFIFYKTTSVYDANKNEFRSFYLAGDFNNIKDINILDTTINATNGQESFPCHSYICIAGFSQNEFNILSRFMDNNLEMTMNLAQGLQYTLNEVISIEGNCKQAILASAIHFSAIKRKCDEIIQARPINVYTLNSNNSLKLMFNVPAGSELDKKLAQNPQYERTNRPN